MIRLDSSHEHGIGGQRAHTGGLVTTRMPADVIAALLSYLDPQTQGSLLTAEAGRCATLRAAAKQQHASRMRANQKNKRQNILFICALEGGAKSRTWSRALDAWITDVTVILRRRNGETMVTSWKASTNGITLDHAVGSLQLAADTRITVDIADMAFAANYIRGCLASDHRSYIQSTVMPGAAPVERPYQQLVLYADGELNDLDCVAWAPAKCCGRQPAKWIRRDLFPNATDRDNFYIAIHVNEADAATVPGLAEHLPVILNAESAVPHPWETVLNIPAAPFYP